MDLALNNLQWLFMPSNQTKPNYYREPYWQGLKYTICNPSRRVRSSLMGCPEYETKLHLMIRLQFWRSGECGVPLHCHYS